MNSLVVIAARGGSKGVPRKNIKLLNGKPLIQYTIDAALDVFDKNDICVSTDDEEIKGVVEKLGVPVPFLRPKHLATSEVGVYPVLLHALDFYRKQRLYHPDTIILLQPTSPFRTGKNILEAMAFYDQDCEMVVSVKETGANPYFVLREENEEGWLVKSKKGNFVRRQDCPKVYELNGAIYIINVEALEKRSMGDFTKVRKYVMSDIESHDIDTTLDWIIAEALVKKVHDA